ncbi:signal recognition particle-docking protein FtsY [candidate division KSB1 bacterium]|nr:signal recognition particle-docking protein FtsY [candidate division KSB1 bacterium]RQW10784.1 MAG: signal recognition particle-docking protein FtsY [candidate division KSB1 bacterium]
MLSALAKLAKGLAKTRAGFFDGVSSIVKGRRIDAAVLDELEELLILSDLGVDTAEQCIADLRERARQSGAVTEQEVVAILKNDLVSLFKESGRDETAAYHTKPHVISVVGVNGTGKTTTIGKLAHRFAGQGKRVLLGAADTFRAAAVDQLDIWADRSHVDVIHSQAGADPASVSFDALKAAISRQVDVLLIDTAGRLHTKKNLMAELTKIHSVLKKQMPDAPHEVLLVIDATTGQNGLVQAKQFAEAVDVTGLVLTKLDGTAKGGIVFSIARELYIPVRYIGIGEGIDDLEEFDAETFVEAFFQ